MKKARSEDHWATLGRARAEPTSRDVENYPENYADNYTDEYSVVRLTPSWGLLSTTLFVLSLPLRFWARVLPWHPSQYYYRPGWMLLGTLALSAAGLICALIGRRGQTGRGLARWGLILNASLAVLLTLVVAGLFAFWRFR